MTTAATPTTSEILLADLRRPAGPIRTLGDLVDWHARHPEATRPRLARPRARARRPRRHSGARSSARSGDSGSEDPEPSGFPEEEPSWLEAVEPGHVYGVRDPERCPRCERVLLFIQGELRCCVEGCGVERPSRWSR